MPSTIDVSVSDVVAASPDRVRSIMFDARQDPNWMAAVKSVDVLDDGLHPGSRVRRVGKFLGRTLRWTTVVRDVSAGTLTLEIVDGPMRGTVTYLIETDGTQVRVTIRNVGDAPGFAPRWLLRLGMRRSLAADLRRLKQLAEART